MYDENSFYSNIGTTMLCNISVFEDLDIDYLEKMIAKISKGLLEKLFIEFCTEISRNLSEKYCLVIIIFEK